MGHVLASFLIAGFSGDPCDLCPDFPNPLSNDDYDGDGVDSNCNGHDDCFIATAAFGSPLEPRIDVLRSFRDQVLLKTPQGRRLVECHYGKGPWLARLIEKHALVRGLVRILLLPVIGVAHLLV